MTITLPSTSEFLRSKITDYELDLFDVVLISEEYDDCVATLDLHLFNKEVYDLPRGTSDPTEVISIGKYNINSLDAIDLDYRDEWDLSDVCEVFHKHLNKAKVDFC